MPKTKKQEITIKAENIDEEHVEVTINGKTFNCRIQQSGKIKFTFKHPEVKKAMEYEGIVENDKLWLYPIVGEGVLADGPIKIK